MTTIGTCKKYLNLLFLSCTCVLLTCTSETAIAQTGDGEIVSIDLASGWESLIGSWEPTCSCKVDDVVEVGTRIVAFPEEGKGSSKLDFLFAFNTGSNCGGSCDSVTLIRSLDTSTGTPFGIRHEPDSGGQDTGNQMLLLPLETQGSYSLAFAGRRAGDDNLGAVYIVQSLPPEVDQCILDLPVAENTSCREIVINGTEDYQRIGSGGLASFSIGEGASYFVTGQGQSLAFFPFTKLSRDDSESIQPESVLSTSEDSGVTSLLGQEVGSEMLYVGQSKLTLNRCEVSDLYSGGDWSLGVGLCDEYSYVDSVEPDSIERLMLYSPNKLFVGSPKSNEEKGFAALYDYNDGSITTSLLDFEGNSPQSKHFGSSFAKLNLDIDHDGEEAVLTAIGSPGLQDGSTSRSYVRLGRLNESGEFTVLLEYSTPGVYRFGRALAGLENACPDSNGSATISGLLVSAPGITLSTQQDSSDSPLPILLLCPDQVIDQDGDGSPLAQDCNDHDSTINPNATDGCTIDGVDNDCDDLTDEGQSLDNDNDGYPLCDDDEAVIDCDDQDESVYPGAAEVCGGKDNDCDGKVDEGLDNDNDGVTNCGDDCDDGDAEVNPGASELCDGKDNDCDEAVDEGFDEDGDEYTQEFECRGFGGTDCDDKNASIYPGALEQEDGLDNDCDGISDESTGAYDDDGDGYCEDSEVCLHHDLPNDCNDNDPLSHPGATERCDGKDNDCDESIDELMDASGNLVCVEQCDNRDNDGDGIIDEDPEPEVDGHSFDEDGDGVLWCNGDCDDSNALISPRSTETCNDLDDDCDQNVDEGQDSDSDGWTWCEEGASGFGMDCDGAHAQNPGVPEVCNGVDDDCDGDIDEGFDFDGDGYSSCSGSAPEKYDCDDKDPLVNPSQAEVCDDKDHDCDGAADEGYDQDGDGTLDCIDDDGDGWVECEIDNPDTQILCDCDDRSASVGAGSIESCDGLDNDCDHEIDENFDLDGDGWATCGVIGSPGSAYDCNDSDVDINPGKDEDCDGIDQDCDGSIDENHPEIAGGDHTCDSIDDDDDGLLECNQESPIIETSMACSLTLRPADQDLTSADCDCDDQNPFVGGSAIEVCDAIDNDCDGRVDEDFDLDGDCHLSASACSIGTDCNDREATIYLGAEESCNGDDDDCDGQVDEYGLQLDEDLDNSLDCVDDDGDGQFDCNEICEDDDGNTVLCTTYPSGSPDLNCDCDDHSDLTYVGASEVPDYKDNDCDGTVDEGTVLFSDDEDEQSEEEGDCDDSDANTWLGAPELGDWNGDGQIDGVGIDNDCDGLIDEGTARYDDDGDGYCEQENDCEPRRENDVVSFVQGGDCDDSSESIHPGAVELSCDGLDQDCSCEGGNCLCISGDPSCTSSEVSDAMNWADGVDTDGLGGLDCHDSDGDGFSEDGTIGGLADCDDTTTDVWPGSEEVCDQMDNDCNGRIDEGVGFCTAGCSHSSGREEGADFLLPSLMILLTSRRRKAWVSHSSFVALLLLCLFGMAPETALGQSCHRSIDAQSFQEILTSIDEALLDNRFAQARALAIDGQKLLPCVNAHVSAHSISKFPMSAALASWYLSESEGETRRWLREALVLAPEQPGPEGEAAGFLELLEDERRLLMEGSRYTLIPSSSVSSDLRLDGVTIESEFSVWPGEHLVQMDGEERMTCTHWLNLPATSGRDEVRYLRFGSSVGNLAGCHTRLEPSTRAPVSKANVILIAGGVSSIAAGVSGVLLQRQYAELKSLEASCPSALEAEAKTYRASLARSWALIGTSAGLLGVGINMRLNESSQLTLRSDSSGASVGVAVLLP